MNQFLTEVCTCTRGCDAQDVVGLFDDGVETGNESEVENGVPAPEDKREREFFEVSAIYCATPTPHSSPDQS